MRKDFKEGYGYFLLSKVSRTDDWNSLPKEKRKESLNNLQVCLAEYCRVHVPERELNELCEFAGSIEVVDAILDLYAVLDANFNEYQIRKWLRKRVINSIKSKLRRVPESYPEIKPLKPKKVATYEQAKKYSSFSLNHRCLVCGSVLNANNITGKCTKCQHDQKD